MLMLILAPVKRNDTLFLPKLKYNHLVEYTGNHKQLTLTKLEWISMMFDSDRRVTRYSSRGQTLNNLSLAGGWGCSFSWVTILEFTGGAVSSALI